MCVAGIPHGIRVILRGYCVATSHTVIAVTYSLMKVPLAIETVEKNVQAGQIWQRVTVPFHATRLQRSRRQSRARAKPDSRPASKPMELRRQVDYNARTMCRCRPLSRSGKPLAGRPAAASATIGRSSWRTIRGGSRKDTTSIYQSRPRSIIGKTVCRFQYFFFLKKKEKEKEKEAPNLIALQHLAEKFQRIHMSSYHRFTVHHLSIKQAIMPDQQPRRRCRTSLPCILPLHMSGH